MPRPAEGAEPGDEAAAWRNQVATVERVISHLIAKDGVLVVVDTPQVRKQNGKLQGNIPELDLCTGMLQTAVRHSTVKAAAIWPAAAITFCSHTAAVGRPW